MAKSNTLSLPASLTKRRRQKKDPVARQPDRQPIRTWTLDDPELSEVVHKFAGSLCTGWLQQFSQDVAQECFVRLAKMGDLPNGKPRTFCSAFLWTTVLYTRNDLARKEGRRQKREKSLEAESGVFEMESPLPETDPHRVTRGWEHGQAIRECLAGLRTEYRQAVILRLVGYKSEEIADRLGCDSPKQAENRASRGLEKLRKCLVKKGAKS